jgi:cytochrome c-type biogenesis protein CcmH
MKRWMLTLLLLALASFATAQQIEYRDDAEATRFRALTEELRCVMCQNQSIADSTAPIAQDLRVEILQLMREGKSDAQIKEYLVERYTEFVLYKPEVKPMTWLLWFGPGLLILVGGLVIVVIVKKQSPVTKASPPSTNHEEW